MLYEFLCRNCQLRFDLVRTVENRKKRANCPKCGKKAHRVYATNVYADDSRGSRIPGVCRTLPGPPVYVKSKAHFRELCKKHGLYPAGV